MAVRRPEQLAAAHTAALRSARLRGMSREDAEDAVQEALARALAADAVLDDEGRDVTGWLRTVSNRLHVDTLRHRQHERPVPDLPDTADPAGYDDPAEVLADRAHAAYVAAAVTALPLTTQEVVHELDRGRSVPDIARDFGVSNAAVHKHIGRARTALRGRSVLAGLALLLAWLKRPQVAGAGTAAVALAAAAVAVAAGPSSQAPPWVPAVTAESPTPMPAPRRQVTAVSSPAAEGPAMPAPAARRPTVQDAPLPAPGPVDRTTATRPTPSAPGPVASPSPPPQPCVDGLPTDPPTVLCLLENMPPVRTP